MRKYFVTRIFKSRKGFTLVEVLIVVTVIGLLSASIYVAVTSLKPKARNAKRQSDLVEVREAILHFADDNNGFVPVGDNSESATESAYQSLAASISPDYLTILPKDPKIEVAGSAGDYQYISLEQDGLTGTIIPQKANRFHLIAPSAERGETIKISQ